jgi:hypothetical protein
LPAGFVGKQLEAQGRFGATLDDPDRAVTLRSTDFLHHTGITSDVLRARLNLRYQQNIDLVTASKSEGADRTRARK